MNNDDYLLRLQGAWRKCERHVYHIFHAIKSMRTFLPEGSMYGVLTTISADSAVISIFLLDKWKINKNTSK